MSTAIIAPRRRPLAIRVERVSKTYFIGHDARVRESLRDTIARVVKNPLASRATSTPFVALDEVSLDVREGEVVGVIGRNGAGKSTLLKILAGITEPTSGRVLLYGRVASLLEIGAGFHGDLTGRENVFLNGAILGMKRREIARRLDEIVAFAEVEQFLDTPVKRYSSGMYVRLAFAVAAHLEQEILLVDEVLAVGDAAFQRKCLQKIGDVADGGRTVVFVTHHMGALRQLTERAVLLDRGRVAFAGPLEEAVTRYLDVARGDAFEFVRSEDERDARALASIDRVRAVVDDDGRLTGRVGFTLRARAQAAVSVRLLDEEGVPVCTVRDVDADPDRMEKDAGAHALAFTTDPLSLAAGTYFVSVSLSDLVAERHDHVERCVTLSVAAPAHLRSAHWREGAIAPRSSWTRD